MEVIIHYLVQWSQPSSITVNISQPSSITVNIITICYRILDQLPKNVRLLKYDQNIIPNVVSDIIFGSNH